MPVDLTTRDRGPLLVTLTESQRVAVCTACGWSNKLADLAPVDGLELSCARCQHAIRLKLVRPAAARSADGT